MNVVNCSFQKGQLSTTKRQGIFSLLPQKDKIFVFEKIRGQFPFWTNAIGNRMKRVLAKVINNDQSGLLKGKKKIMIFYQSTVLLFTQIIWINPVHWLWEVIRLDRVGFYRKGSYIFQFWALFRKLVQIVLLLCLYYYPKQWMGLRERYSK